MLRRQARKQNSEIVSIDKAPHLRGFIINELHEYTK